MTKVRLEFCKAGELRWLSHLELSRAWQRIIARAGLPLAYSEGFSPHPKIALSSALPVGVGSEAEYADIVLTASTPIDEMIMKINAASPAGIKVSRAKEVTPGTAKLGASIKLADYRLTFCGSPEAPDDIVTTIRLPIETKLNEAIASAKESILDEKTGKTRSGVPDSGALFVDRVAQFVIVEGSLVDPIEAIADVVGDDG